MAPKMPLVPALSGKPAAKQSAAGYSSLGELLDSLTDDELGQLEAMAGGEQQDDGAGATDVGDADGGLEDEPDAGDPNELAEGETGEADAQSILTAVTGASDEAEQVGPELDALLKSAQDNAKLGGQPKEIQKLVKEAEGIVKEIEDLVDEVTDALDEEDVGAAAEAAMKAQELVTHLGAIKTRAEAYSKSNKPSPEDVKAAEEADKNAPPPTAPKKTVPSLKLWAQRAAGG
jgi:hypothetical protein